MIRMRFLLALAGALILSTGSSMAKADLPADRTVVFYIRQVPTDPQSDIAWSVKLAVTAADSIGESVGWRVTALSIENYDDAYVPHRRWIEDAPTLTAPDGLWWLDHADHLNPQTAEFNVMPLLTGTATAVDPLHADLHYSFAGARYYGEPYYEGRVSALSFRLALVGEEEPEDEGDDEPEEIDEEEDPPSGS